MLGIELELTCKASAQPTVLSLLDVPRAIRFLASGSGPISETSEGQSQSHHPGWVDCGPQNVIFRYRAEEKLPKGTSQPCRNWGEGACPGRLGVPSSAFRLPVSPVGSTNRMGAAPRVEVAGMSSSRFWNLRSGVTREVETIGDPGGSTWGFRAHDHAGIGDACSVVAGPELRVLAPVFK